MMNAGEKATWLAERAGCLTASRMCDAMSFLKKGEPSKDRTKYMHELLAERLTGFSVPHVVTPPMERGLLHEDDMFETFADLTGRDVRPSRLYAHPTIEYFKATPDRELDDGLLEGKIPLLPKFIAWKLAGVVPEEHKPQMAAQCLCSGRRWVGFVAYAPEMPKPEQRLFLAKYVPTDDELQECEDGARRFLDELEALFRQFTEQPA